MPDYSVGARAAAEPDVRAAKVLFGKYEVGRLLGCGAFAKVYHARHMATGTGVAIKVISTPRLLRAGLAANLTREIVVMRQLRHPHVLRLHEVLASRSRVYLVLELARGGELFAHVARAGRLSEDTARAFFRQLLSAVAFCHARGVFHRDIKPENLLLDHTGRLKVSDFGLAAGHVAAGGLLHTLCGTPAYVAPEILSKKGYDGAKADLWSCGVVLFVLTAGFLPFNDPNLMSLYRKIYRGEYRCPKWTSPELRCLLSRLLDTKPDTRITVEEILIDPWFRKGLPEKEIRDMMRVCEDVTERKLLEAVAINGDGKEEEERELNAFDIISFSSGFDLSGLFGARPSRERFVSNEPAEAVLRRVEEVARDEELPVRRKSGSKAGRGAAAVEGPSGGLVAWVQVYRLADGLAVVEVELGGAATEAGRWDGEFWRERLRAAVNRPGSSQQRHTA